MDPTQTAEVPAPAPQSEINFDDIPF